jgi:arylsulfatase A
MERDPEQKRDASAEFADEKRKLVSAYDEWWKNIKAELITPWPPPIAVGDAQENPVELPVPQAEFTGGLRFSGKHPNNAWLVNWTNMNARVEWKIDVKQPGDYEARLLYLAADGGAKVRVAVGTNSAEATIQSTPIVQVPSPDRVPRDEVHEMQWHELLVGKLSLSRGTNTLSVQALTRPGPEVMQLKSVLLRRH